MVKRHVRLDENRQPKPPKPAGRPLGSFADSAELLVYIKGKHIDAVVTPEVRSRVEAEDQEARMRSIARTADMIIGIDRASGPDTTAVRIVQVKARGESTPGGRMIRYEMPVYWAGKSIIGGGDGA